MLPYRPLSVVNLVVIFCMINILNRNDNDEIGVAGNYSAMRYWTPEFIIGEFEKINKIRSLYNKNNG